MYTKDAIRYALTLADQAVMRSLALIEDAPFTFPTQNGGCHPLWVIGHLAFVEGMACEMLGGGASSVADWAPLFGQDTLTTAESSQYPPMAEVKAKYVEFRQRNLELLDAMSEADLDQKTPWQPAGLEEHFGTYGKALLTIALHQTMHRGHVTDSLRASAA